MSESEEIKKAVKLYRAGMRDEIASADVARDKREFIARHFGEEAVFQLRPVHFVPAFSVMACLALLILLGQPPGKELLEMKSEPSYTYSEMTLVPEESAVPIERPTVEVKRLTSQVGPTAIYQKVFKETPITIVWVFPSGQ